MRTGERGILETESDYLRTMAKTIFGDIPGGIHYQEGVIALMAKRDVVALQHLVQSAAKKKMMIAEVGSFMGGTTAILARAVANLGGEVFAIDHWLGSPGTWEERLAQSMDIYTYFKGNMIDLGVWDIIHPLVMNSETASRIFANGILDLAFIDADHRYESAKQDILGWLPKLKRNGTLCGHDANYPSVIKAVEECFGDTYSIMPDSTIWYINGEPLQEAKRRLRD